MTSVVYSVAKVVPITPFLLGIQVLIKGLQLPRWGTPSGRESPAFTSYINKTRGLYLDSRTDPGACRQPAGLPLLLALLAPVQKFARNTHHSPHATHTPLLAQFAPELAFFNRLRSAARSCCSIRYKPRCCSASARWRALPCFFDDPRAG